MNRDEAITSATATYNAARAALDRMVEIADESGMYDLPPMNEADDIVEELRDWGDIVNGSKGSAEVVFISGDFLHEAATEIERLRAEIKVLHMALDSHYYAAENQIP